MLVELFSFKSTKKTKQDFFNSVDFQNTENQGYTVNECMVVHLRNLSTNTSKKLSLHRFN